MRRGLAICAVLALAAAAPAAAAVPGPLLHFSTFTTTDLALGQVEWTGSAFLYDAENAGQIETSDAAGQNLRELVDFDSGGEEMRCHANPTTFWPSGIYCHTPDNRIVRVAPDGSSVTLLARLPAGQNSDGALAFDTGGRFGHLLLAATGGSSVGGGQVFAIHQNGKVDPIGTYPGPGGAENIVVAPPRFGSASGALLISVDEDPGSGRLLAMDRQGRVQTLAAGFANGLNPLAVIAPAAAKRAPSVPAAGLYLADTVSKAVWFAPATALRPFAGAVIVGTEVTGELWIVRPAGKGKFARVAVTTDLPQQQWNFEGATYVG
jgi:hypothetical protein